MHGTSIPDDLRDGLVSLRGLRIADAPWLFEGYRDPSVAAQTANEQSLSVDSVDAALGMIGESKRRARSGDGFAIAICRVTDDEPVGEIQLDAVQDRDDEALLGFWVRAEHRGHRYASAGVALAMSWAYGSLGVRRIWADVQSDNVASRRLLVSAGFRECSAELPEGLPADSTSLVVCAEL